MNRFILFLFSLFSFFLYSQEVSEKYEKEVSPIENGIYLLKQSLQPSPNSNICISVYYKGKENDFVVFYDNLGQDVKVKYRENKFDYQSEKIIEGLNRGNGYLLSISLLGAYIYKSENFIPEYVVADKLSLEEWKDRNTIPVFKPSKIEQCSQLPETHVVPQQAYSSKFFLPLELTRLYY